MGMLVVVILLSPSGSSRAANTLDEAQVVDCPVVLLKHWQAANQTEKMSFLLGFVTMLEMDKEWQGQKPLPITASINQSWVRGLADVTFGQMAKRLDEYVAAHPDKLDMPLVEALGRIYVVPKMTEKELQQAEDHYRAMRNIGDAR
jgi:hypothetical protein